LSNAIEENKRTIDEVQNSLGECFAMVSKFTEQFGQLRATITARCDGIEQTAARLIADSESHQEKFFYEKIDKLSKAFETSLNRQSQTTLKEAVQYVWRDLDGTLKTIREDFDASLNQRTQSLITKIEESRANTHHDNWSEIVQQVKDLDEKIELLQKAVHGDDFFTFTEEDIKTKLNELRERISREFVGNGISAKPGQLANFIRSVFERK
jgi:hypothetical protein